MNVKLVYSTYFAIFFLLSVAPAPGEEHHSCPDLSEHAKILKQGVELEKLNRTPSRGLPGGLMWSLTSMSDHIPRYNESVLRHQLEELQGAIPTMPLDTYHQRVAAESYARQFEEFGMYKDAVCVYERLLAGQTSEQIVDGDRAKALNESLLRVKLCQSARRDFENQHFKEAISSWDKVVDSIYKLNSDLLSKSCLLKIVLADLYRASEKQVHLPGTSAEELTFSHKVISHAETIMKNWERELECLGMAQKLDHTAWNLERSGEYGMAEKLYRQSLHIKLKNLGSDDATTLAQYANLARIYAAQGKKEEACRFYEDALSGMRKLSNPGREFATMLENYGDMLDNLKKYRRAEEIYAEARRYHERVRASN